MDERESWESERAAPHRFLPDPEVLEIRRKYLAGKEINTIATEHKISAIRVEKICTGETYRNVPMRILDLFDEEILVPLDAPVEVSDGEAPVVLGDIEFGGGAQPVELNGIDLSALFEE